MTALMLMVAQKVSEEGGSNDTVICEAMVICEGGYGDL